MIRFVVLVSGGMLLALTSISGARPTQPPPVSPEVASIRDVPWRDFTYRCPMPSCPRCLGAGDLRLVNGRTVPDPVFADLGAHLVRVAYADVTGDAAEEALVEVTWRYSPKGTSTRYYLYTLKDRHPVLVWCGFRLSYEEETSGIMAADLGRRRLTVDDLDGLARHWRISYAGTSDGKLKVVRKERVKPAHGK
jgi:hypothetical protein